MADIYAPCKHPDHSPNRDCLDRSVGCSRHCKCCMDDLAIPLPCLNSRHLKMEAYKWFEEREPLIYAAKNRPERDHRLKWLSEGSLHYHLSQFTAPYHGPAGCPKEKALYAEFVASNPPLLKRYAKMPRL